MDANTDPTDEWDHPYRGGWEIGACRWDVRATGNGIGQVTENFALYDQYGELVKLHDFCDRAIILVASATWCGPCNAEAPELGAWYDQFDDEGLMVITLLGENMFGDPPSQGDLRDWAETHGLSHPVVADPGWGVTIRYIDGYSIGLPSLSLLGGGAEVVIRDGYVDESTVERALNEL